MHQLHILQLQGLPPADDDQREGLALMQALWQYQAVALAVVDKVSALRRVSQQPRLRGQPQVLCSPVLSPCIHEWSVKIGHPA